MIDQDIATLYVERYLKILSENMLNTTMFLLQLDLETAKSMSLIKFVSRILF